MAEPTPGEQRLRSRKRRRSFKLVALSLAFPVALTLGEVGAAVYLSHKDRDA